MCYHQRSPSKSHVVLKIDLDLKFMRLVTWICILSGLVIYNTAGLNAPARSALARTSRLAVVINWHHFQDQWSQNKSVSTYVYVFLRDDCCQLSRGLKFAHTFRMNSVSPLKLCWSSTFTDSSGGFIKLLFVALLCSSRMLSLISLLSLHVLFRCFQKRAENRFAAYSPTRGRHLIP